MYGKKFQRMVAGIIAGILAIAMIVTGILGSMSF